MNIAGCVRGDEGKNSDGGWKVGGREKVRDGGRENEGIIEISLKQMFSRAVTREEEE